jgi:hypothetical protein
MRTRAFIPVSSRHRVATIGLAIILLTIPAVTIATDQFSDVKDTNQFHDNINNIANAGITSGCGDGTTYCPGGNVTRGQMAGFLNRGLGRATAGYGGIPLGLADAADPAQVTITTGGVTGGTGFVVVTGSVTAYTQDAGVCPCEIIAWISGPDEDSPAIWFDVSDTATPSGYRNGAGSVSWVFAAPSGTEATYDLAVDATTSGPVPTEDLGFIEGTITAVYVPFGSEGSSTLGAGAGLETFDSGASPRRAR